MVVKELEPGAGTLDQKPPSSELCVQTLEDVKAWMEIYDRKRKGDDRAELIFQMMKDFRKFCEEYVNTLHPLLATKKPEWLESAIDTALLEYWLPIRQAAEQYRVAHYRNQLFEGAYQELTLLQNELAGKLKLKMDIQILLYFEKLAKAKRYPFGNAYLIGAPLADGYAGDWAALPHELGHHLYWNARFDDDDAASLPARGTNFLSKEIKEALDKMQLPEASRVRKHLRNILCMWTEEIFADVVGARLAGERFVEAAWERIKRKVPTDKQEELFQSDGQHVMFYAMPYIRAVAAEKKFTDQSFRDQWKEIYGEIHYTELVSQDGQPTAIKFEMLLSALRFYVENITARLKGIRLDKLIHEDSPVTALMNFLDRLEPRKPHEEKLMLLLKPYILEKGEYWTCVNGHEGNSGALDYCSICHVAHHWWFYLAR